MIIIQPRKKEGHCDIAARTVLLYVLLCLTYMYCTLYILYILHTVHIVHVSLFLSFPCLSDVEASSSTSVHACFCSHFISNHKCTFTYLNSSIVHRAPQWVPHFLYIYLSINLSIYLSIFIYIYQYIYRNIYVCISLSKHMIYICLWFICLGR